MHKNTVIEDNIVEYYSDFHALSDLQDDYEGFINLPDRNSELCKQIFEIVHRDLMKQAKSDLITYILEDVCNLIDWDYITGQLQNYYFAERENELE